MTDTSSDTQDIQRRSSKGSAYELKRMFNSKEKSFPKESKELHRDNK